MIPGPPTRYRHPVWQCSPLCHTPAPATTLLVKTLRQGLLLTGPTGQPSTCQVRLMPSTWASTDAHLLPGGLPNIPRNPPFSPELIPHCSLRTMDFQHNPALCFSLNEKNDAAHAEASTLGSQAPRTDTSNIPAPLGKHCIFRPKNISQQSREKEALPQSQGS